MTHNSSNKCKQKEECNTNPTDPRPRAQLKSTKTRRGHKKRKQLTEKLVIMGTNANGLKTKRKSFSDLLITNQPQVVMVQETKMKRPNQLTVKGYELFEKIRKNKD